MLNMFAQDGWRRAVRFSLGYAVDNGALGGQSGTIDPGCTPRRTRAGTLIRTF